MANQKRVKTCVYFTRVNNSSWCKFWIGGIGKDKEGVSCKPNLMCHLTMEFWFRNGWTTPGHIAAYLIVRDPRVIK